MSLLFYGDTFCKGKISESLLRLDFQGEEVKEGQLSAYVGFDAQKAGKVREKTDECYWVMEISDAEFEKMMRG